MLKEYLSKLDTLYNLEFVNTPPSLNTHPSLTSSQNLLDYKQEQNQSCCSKFFQLIMVNLFKNHN